MTQPAISLQIQNLEKQLEVAIFDRGGRKAQLTEGGKLLLGYCERILNLCDETCGAIEDLHNLIKKTEINCFLSGENDGYDIYLEIHAGAGGTESQDWADMLRRMYLKWFDKRKFKYQLISEHKGDEAGIKSTTIHNPIRVIRNELPQKKTARLIKVISFVNFLNFSTCQRKSVYNSNSSKEISFPKISIKGLAKGMILYWLT